MQKIKKIPNEVTENISIEDIEVENFLFSFKFYKNKLCQLSDLQSSNLKKMLFKNQKFTVSLFLSLFHDYIVNRPLLNFKV